jgi:Family of unknown function (DUF5677)
VNTHSVEIEMGYRDFWPVVFQRYEGFCTLGPRVLPLVHEIFSQPHSEPLHKICRHLAKMTANSVGAVLLLGMNGYGYDALKLARTMFESAVTVAYLRKHPRELRDFMDFHFIVAMNRHRYLEQYAPHKLKKVAREVIESTLKGYARVAPRFTDKGRVRSRWCRYSFSRMCSEVNLAEHYRSFYVLSSSLIHSDVSGIMAQADPEPGVLDVDIAPSLNFVDMAFTTAHFSFVFATTEYIAIARPDKQHLVEQLNQGFESAWKK